MAEPIRKLILGTRGSALAMWQARHVQTLLERTLSVVVELAIIKTSGDKNTAQPLSEIGALAGGKGLFVKEIEEALLERRVDLAVHSSKDLPSSVTDGLVIAAFLEREDARDALLVRPGRGTGFAQLPRGAKVGTSSLRRAAQIRSLRPDLETLDLRGNVDTRVRKLGEGPYDAIVLAHAGLKRMGLGKHVTQLFSVDEMIPAVGQGAIGVEVRAGEALEAQIRAALEHAPTRVALDAERGFLAHLGGGCQVPVGAHATLRGTEVFLSALISQVPTAGREPRIVRGRKQGEAVNAAAIGAALAAEMLANGGKALLEA